MPVSSWSRSAAMPEGAPPRTGIPRRGRPAATAWVALVLPAPASPTTATTRSPLVATVADHGLLLGRELHGPAVDPAHEDLCRLGSADGVRVAGRERLLEGGDDGVL